MWIHLTGSYQIENAATALEFIHSCKIDRISEEAARRGLEKAKWTGRFSCISESPIFIIDGAHNEAAALKLRESLEKYFPDKKMNFICGVFKDKEYEKIAQIMAPLAKKIYTVNLPNKERTLDAEVLSEVMLKYCSENCKTEAVRDISKAVEKVLRETEKDEVILAFGSLSYLSMIIDCVKKYI